MGSWKYSKNGKLFDKCSEKSTVKKQPNIIYISVVVFCGVVCFVFYIRRCSFQLWYSVLSLPDSIQSKHSMELGQRNK